jgi:long-chain fatty acid transport protein
MRRSLVIAGTALAAAALPAVPAFAQGSGVMTHGSCATALGAAGVGSPCHDGSAILFNPAGLVNHGSVLSGGLTQITTGGKFVYDYTGNTVTREDESKNVPWGYASLRLGDRVAVGVGGFAPYGLGVSWPMDFEGRYVSYDTELKNIYIQPTVAFRVHPRFAVGAGLDVVRASIKINQRVDLATTATTTPGVTFGNLGIASGTDFANAHLEGDGNAITFNVGATAKLTDRVDLGVRYMHRAKVDYDGDAVFTQVPTGITLAGGNPFGVPAGTSLDAIVAPQFTTGGKLVNQSLSTQLTLPSQLVVGIAARPVESVRLLADFQRTGWASFDSAQIAFSDGGPSGPLILDYQNTNTFRFGADWSATDALNLRGGFIYNTAAEKAASVSPLLPEGERNYLTAGLGYAFGPLTLDLGYQHIHQSDRRGRTRSRTSFAQTPAQLNQGVYRVHAHVLNATLSFHPGGRAGSH